MFVRKYTITIWFVIAFIKAQAQDTISFNSVNETMASAEKQAVSLKTSHTQYLLAKYDVLMAKINIANPKGIISASVINNLQLPINFLPGEVFGGPPGSFQEISLGQQYVGNINISPQIDIINLAAWNKLKVAKLNAELAAVNELLAKKSLLETVAATYFNIISIQEQTKILNQNLVNNDSIFGIASNKYDKGLIRQQDLNQTEVNKLLMEDKISQLGYSLEQQINVLKLLCDFDEDKSLKISHDENKSVIDLEQAPAANNTLLSQQSLLKNKVALAENKASKKNLYPTLSLVGNWAWQDNSNESFFNKNSSQFDSYYVGLRLSYNIPSFAFFSQLRKTQTNLIISDLNNNHLRLEEKINNKQLQLDYQKSIKSLDNSKRVLALKVDSYQKNQNIYLKDLLTTDKLLLSLNERINASMTYKVNEINSSYYLTKIVINQSVQ